MNTAVRCGADFVDDVATDAVGCQRSMQLIMTVVMMMMVDAGVHVYQLSLSDKLQQHTRK